MDALHREFPSAPERDDYVAVCFCCGWPLSLGQIAVDFEGTIADYDQRRSGVPVKFAMCRECFDKGKLFIDEGLDAAYRRLYIACIMKDGGEILQDDE